MSTFAGVPFTTADTPEERARMIADANAAIAAEIERVTAPWFSSSKPKWPRDFQERIERMYKFVQWKRACIRKRMIIHLWAAAGIAFGTPVAIFVGSWLWRFAIDAVTR